MSVIEFPERPPQEIVIPIPLTPVQCNVLRDLMKGETVTQCARNAKIHRSTVHRWMQQDHFRLTLENSQREVHMATFFQIQSMLQPALTRLGELMLHPKTSPATTLRIYECFAAQQHKALPPMPTTNRENLAIMSNLLDPTTPDLDVDATKCDTSTPISETSQPSATECDTPTSIPETSHSEAGATECDTPTPISTTDASEASATSLMSQLARKCLAFIGNLRTLLPQAANTASDRMPGSPIPPIFCTR